MNKNLVIAMAMSAFALSYFNSADAQTATTDAPSAKTQTTKSQTSKKEDKKKSPEQIAKNQANEMKTKLSLSDTQTKQIESLYLANLKNKNLNPTEDKKLMHQQTHDDVMKVLTPEQQKKLKEIREEKEKEKKDENKNNQK